MAGAGLKAMIPVGRPLLDYILSGLADVGIKSVCLVIGPEHSAVRHHFAQLPPFTRLSLDYAIQERPLGTADAVRAAESFAGNDPVLVVNGDNYYPRAALEGLTGIPRAGLAGFRRSGLLGGGHIPPERVTAFALIAADGDGYLTRIVEKPSPAEAASFGPDPLVSMNAWLLPPTIYQACQAVAASRRGEYELQDAVRIAMERMGERFRVVESDQPVLDLSARGDVPGVAAQLAALEVRL